MISCNTLMLTRRRSSSNSMVASCRRPQLQLLSQLIMLAATTMFLIMVFDHENEAGSCTAMAYSRGGGAERLAQLRRKAEIAKQVEKLKEVKEFLAWVDKVQSRSMEKSETLSEFDIIPEQSPGSLVMRVESVITVDQDPANGADFQTVQAAVDSIPKGNSQRIIVKIAPGVYQEKVKVPKNKPYITFMGAGRDATKITWDDTAASSHSTFRSATVSVMSDGFVARSIAFENTAPAPEPGAVGAQAVAFQVSGDQSALYDCAFYGAQDTLYDHKGRHYYQNCLIVGSIDFIFGDALSLYEGCELRTLSISTGSLTAQKRKSSSEDTGFSFMNCNVTGDGAVYLGRAWGAYSRVVFLHSFLGTTILPGGWNDWGIPDRENTAFYAEYDCFGPGANLQNRVAWAHQLTSDQAAPFMSIDFIDGESWLASIS